MPLENEWKSLQEHVVDELCMYAGRDDVPAFVFRGALQLSWDNKYNGPIIGMVPESEAMTNMTLENDRYKMIVFLDCYGWENFDYIDSVTDKMTGETWSEFK